MNKDTVKGGWRELKGKIQKQWGKLTDDDLTAIEGNYEEIAGRLQKTYGYSKDRAQKEFSDFKRQSKF